MSDKLTQKEKAKQLYLKGYNIAAIAETIGCTPKTIYNYKKLDRLNGIDWDFLKQVHDLKPSALKGTYSDLIKEILVLAAQDEEYKKSPGFADAMSKHFKNLKSLYPQELALGLVLDLIDKANQYLKEKAPALASQMAKHWQGIKEKIQREIIEADVL